MGTDTSAINAKKEESKPAQTSKNNWKGFGMAVLNSFIQVMVLGMLGANVLYVLSPANLKFLFPDDTDIRPYTNEGPPLFPSKPETQSGGAEAEADARSKLKETMNKHLDKMKEKAAIAVDQADKTIDKANKYGKFTPAAPALKLAKKATSTLKEKIPVNKAKASYVLPPDHCGLDVDPITHSHLFSSKPIQDMYDYGFPYSWKYSKNSNDKSIIGFLKNWIGSNTEKSYAGLREVISKLMGYMEISCELNKDAKWKTLPIFILAPLILFVILMIAQFWSIPTVLYYMLFKHETTYDLLFSLAGLFCGWTLFLAVGASFSQMFGILLIFLLLPLITDGKRVMKILGKRYHSLYLFILFLLMVTSNAFTYLTSEVALAMFVPFIFAIVSSIRHVMKKQ